MKIAKSFYCFFLLLSSAIFCDGQNEPFELGVVNPSDLALTTYEADPDAEAVVLQHNGKLSIKQGSQQYLAELIVKRRIKILKERGISHGDIIIPFYSGNGMEKIRNIKAFITAPNGVVIELHKPDFNEVTIGKYSKEIRISFPQVQVGSIIDLKYEVESKDLVHLRKWYFQENLPIAYSEISLRMLAYFDYKYFFEGYGLSELKALNEEDGEKIPMEINFDGANKFVIKHVPAMRRAGFLSSLENFRCSIRFQLSQINYPDGREEKYMKDWPAFTQDYNQSQYQGKRYTVKSGFNSWVRSYQAAKTGATDALSRIKDAYDFVNKTIAWDGYISVSNQEPLNRILKAGEGNSAALAQSLIVLLRHQGLSAYPMLCSNRSEGYPFKQEPLSDQFTHTLVYVEYDDQYLILEPGHSYLPPGFLMLRSLNLEGLVIKEKEAYWVPIDPGNATSLFILQGEVKDGKLKANIQAKMRGYEALKVKAAEEGYVKRQFLERQPLAVISDYSESYDSKTTPEQDIKFNIELKQSADDNTIYLNPIIYSDFFTNPFKQEKRYYPVEFEYGLTEKYHATIKIPEGYFVEEMPENLAINFGEKGMILKVYYDQKGENISVLFSIKINRLTFHPAEYKKLRSTFDKLAQKVSSPIVLKKT